MKRLVTISLIIFFILYVSIVAVGLTKYAGTSGSASNGPSVVAPTSGSNNLTPSTTSTPITTGSGYTAEVVATHNSLSSCWLIVSGNVYDVTPFLSSDTHRAGNAVILQYCGQDATSAFGVHNSSGYSVLSQYYLSTLK